MQEMIADKLIEIAKELKKIYPDNEELAEDLREVARNSRELAELLYKKKYTDKDIFAEVLRQCADDLDDLTDFKNPKVRFILIHLNEIADKIDCFNTGREYIDPLN